MNILLLKLTPVESMDSANIRTLGLANGLIDKNCTIDYVTIPVSGSHKTKDIRGYKEKMNIIRTANNMLYDSVIGQKGKFGKGIINILRRIYHSLNLYDYTYAIAKTIDISILGCRSYDIVISSSDPKTSHLAVKNLIRQGLAYKKWMQYWGDPMTLDITNKSIYPKWMISRQEKKLLSSADYIIYVSPFTLREQKKLFPKIANKMFFLPIPYTEEKIFDDTRNSKYTLGYYGDYASDVRNINPLYNACVALKSKIFLNIVGNSDLKLEQTDNIKLFQRGDISEFEKKTDLFVCLLNKKGSQLPGKIYHSAATNRPVLVILDGDNINEMKEYLDSFNRFIVCENNVESIISALESILSRKKEFCPAPQFAPDTIAEKFLDLARGGLK